MPGRTPARPSQSLPWRWRSTQMTIQALVYFAPGLVALATTEIITRLFYAWQNTRTPVAIAAVAMAVNADDDPSAGVFCARTRGARDDRDHYPVVLCLAEHPHARRNRCRGDGGQRR